MRLRVEPIYGWGWRDNEGNVMDVPSPFEIEAAVIVPGTKNGLFEAALGYMEGTRHPLSGFWIFLSQRHSTSDGYCNLRAFRSRPILEDLSNAQMSLPSITDHVRRHA